MPNLPYDSNHPDRGVDGQTGPSRPANVYNALLDGKDHYRRDAIVVEKLEAIGLKPHTVAKAGRGFLQRAVHHLAGAENISQFLDVGFGIPAPEGQNTHEIAQQYGSARVLYMDNDPVVVRHGDVYLSDGSQGMVRCVEADFGDVPAIVRSAKKFFDFDQPIAVVLAALVHFIRNEANPHDLVRTLIDAMPAGSYLLLSHVTNEYEPNKWRDAESIYRAHGMNGQTRSRLEISRFFDGLDLLPPGLVPVHRWRPDDDHEHRIGDTTVAFLGGIGVAHRAANG